jgi:hypothetical protein
MKTEPLLRTAIVLLALVPTTFGFDDFKCSTKSTASMVERAACVVTSNFYDKHLAMSKPSAESKTQLRDPVATNTVIEFSPENLSRLEASVIRTGASSAAVSYWTCTLNESKKGRSASCGALTRGTVYFCVSETKKDNRYRIDHLSPGPATCR